MFRNILAAAWGNLARNRLYAAISIAGLAIGLAAALLTALYMRDELSFDRFIPGYSKLYAVVGLVDAPGLRDAQSSMTPAEMAGRLRLDFPNVRRIVRYGPEDVAVTRGRTEAYEKIGWVDPDFFEVFRFKPVVGDLASAVRRPDGLVLTRTAARKYFGAEPPLGQTLLFDRKTPFHVMAVIEDLPSNSNIAAQVFAPAIAPGSVLAQRDAHPMAVGAGYLSTSRIYLQLADARQAAAINKAMPAFIERRVFPPAAKATSPFARGLSLFVVPVADLHFSKEIFPETPPGDKKAVYAMGALAALILLVAGINFVNLMTARAGRRAVEVGVRKVAGASRRLLVIQFIGESLVYALIALVVALAMVELLLPTLNAFTGRQIVLSYQRDPAIPALGLGLGLLLGVIGGLYPAFVLAAFRPADVLKGALVQAAGSPIVRRGLVTLQFAVLIGLLLAVLVMARQTRFAMTEGSGLDTDRVLRIEASCVGNDAEAPRALVERLARIPAVAGVACSSYNAVGQGKSITTAHLPNGEQTSINQIPIGFGFFELYGVQALAGRLPSATYGADRVQLNPLKPKDFHFPTNVVVNAAMVRSMGLPSPQSAIGQSVRINTDPDRADRVTIIGVVPDVQFDLTEGPVKPAFYPLMPRLTSAISVKLKGGRIPEALAAIDKVWRETGDPKPISRRFTDEFLNTVYANIIRQAWLVGGLAAIAIFIGGLGLFALAAFTAERRTKEIGVRKAMGASSPDIVRLLLWSFTQPVLWANLIAWPVGWWVMNRWLEGFSARISLSPLYFLAAGAAALLIAALTVSAHAVRVARAQPVGALRYE